MIKIMIVDDIPVFREYLLNCIDWSLYGFEICCEAKNGLDAIEQFPNYYPDIVLTDITMPYIDGLELSEKLLDKYPDVSIVIITGNSEFEYARKALRLGLCDYIVKPFEKEELILTLLKLKDNINKALETKVHNNRGRSEKREIELRKLLYTDYKVNALQFEAPYFLVYTIKLNKFENLSQTEDIAKWEQIIISMLESNLMAECSIDIFRDFEDNIVVLLNFITEDEMRSFKAYDFEDIIKLVKEHLSFDMTVGISGYCIGMSSVNQGYQQSLEALSRGYYEKKDKVFDYKKIGLDLRGSFYSWDVMESINRNLEQLSYENIVNIIDKALDTDNRIIGEEYRTMMYMSLLGIPFSYIVKIGRNIDDIYGKEFRPYDQLKRQPSFEEKKAFILSCYKKVIDYQLGNKSTKASHIAENARKYIEENYSDPELAIDDISRSLLVNQTYLRQMFKAEMNMTVSDYITKVRMDKARYLILNSEYKLATIAEMVGYNDASYLSKCFKKYFGLSPSAMALNK